MRIYPTTGNPALDRAMRENREAREAEMIRKLDEDTAQRRRGLPDFPSAIDFAKPKPTRR